MNITRAIAFLDKHVQDPSKGLPEEAFFYISRMTSLVNIDRNYSVRISDRIYRMNR